MLKYTWICLQFEFAFGSNFKRRFLCSNIFGFACNLNLHFVLILKEDFCAQIYLDLLAI